jgi:hypothetical protein
MSDMRRLLELFEAKEPTNETVEMFDSFDIELSEHFVIETGIVGLKEDGIVIEADDHILELLEVHEILVDEEDTDISNLSEGVLPGETGTWVHGGYKVSYDPKTLTARITGKNQERSYKFSKSPSIDTYKAKIAGVIDQLEDESSIHEAEYQGRKVPLGKPMAGDVKKSKVYVRKPNGKVVKVNFGDKKMKIKKSNPKRRKSFRARHRCENPGPRWKARYWSCRAW